MIKLGLRPKLITAIILFILLMAGTLVWFFLGQQKTILTSELKKIGVSLTRNLAYDGEYAVITEDEVILRQLIDGVKRADDVVYVAILNSDGKLLAGSDPLGVLQDLPKRREFRYDQIEVKYYIPPKGEALVDIAAPVRIQKELPPEADWFFEKDFQEKGGEISDANGHEIGWVRVGISLKNTNAHIDRLRNVSILVIGLTSMFLVLIIAILLTKVVVQPIHQFVQGAEAIAGGNLEHRIGIKTGDEIGQLAKSFNAMAEELKSNISMLEENEAKYRALFEASNDAVFIIDNEKFLECNKQALKIFGCTTKDIIGQPPLTFSPPKQPDGSLSKESSEAMMMAAFQGKHQRFYWQHIRLDGSTFDAEVSLNPTRIANKAVLQAVVQDISERKKAEAEIQALTRDLEKRVEERTSELEQITKELAKANTQLIEASRLKSQFLANMSHELRTPLNSIIGFTGIILQGIVGELNDEQEKQLKMVYSSAKHLLGLINDILDLSKIEAGKIEIIPAQFEVKELIQTVEKMVSPLIKEKGLAFEIAISRDVPPTIYNDKNRIKQVLINLLSNAIKFTESGEIRLTAQKAEGSKLKAQRESSSFQLSAADFELHRDWIQFSVQDTGIGIRPEHLRDIFDEFKQIEGPLKEKPTGTGLGLAISRKIVEIMGGSIWAESDYGKGSRFEFAVPVKEVTEAKRTAVISPEALALDLSKKLILTIDDEIEAQEILRTYLKGEGYEVIQAYNAMEAMQLAKKYRPFAITLDIIMPGKSGWDILEELKNEPQTEGIPVICISILENREMGLSLGAIEYMVKPIDKDQLIEALWRVEKRIQIYDILIVDDEPKAVELVTRYVDEIDKYRVTKAYGGEEALARVRESRPDLIILDLMMPEVDGFEVIRYLKKSDETKQIPIIIVSAKKLTQEEIGYLNSNIEKIIRKEEFSKENLLKDIKRALEKI